MVFKKVKGFWRTPSEPTITVKLAEWEAKEKRIKELESLIAQQNLRIADLEEKLSATSRNSSKPPSSDPPSADKKTKPGKKKGDRKQGAQEGHEPNNRELLPVEQVDKVVKCMPDGDCDCGGEIRIDEDDPERKQSFEIPKIEPQVTEYKIYSGICIDCGKHHRGKLPQGTPEGILEAKAMAWIAILSGKFHLSKRQIEEIFSEMLGLPICTGTVSNTEGRVSEALSEPVKEAQEFIKTQDVVHMDETGHKVAGKKAWMWLATTSLVSVLIVRFSRGAKVAKEILGEAFNGLLISDRWSAYNWVDAARRQLCWAHLIRDFTKISERIGIAGEIGNRLLEFVRKMFHLWHKLKNGALNRKQLQTLMEPIKKEIETLLEKGTSCGCSKTEGACKRIFKLKNALWTFIDIAGVEPTNNLAERIIRAYVLWRKTSFGTQSHRGNLFVERILTVIATCQLQNRNVLDFVTECIRAHLSQKNPPSLLPQNLPDALSLAA